MRNVKTVSLCLSEEMILQLQELAAYYGMSVSSYCRYLLKRGLVKECVMNGTAETSAEVES